MNFDIDIIYLWCNIEDPEFKKRKEAFSNGLTLHPQANDICRYSDNGELRYSLRSLEKYAPWVRNVFIVTDNQIPEWLNLDNPKVKVINQNDILPDSAKPSFNSIAIEHCLKNIPDLAEHYIYANDDMFFNAPITPDFFFNKKGYPIVRVRKKRKNITGLYLSAVKIAEDLIYKKYNVLIDNEPHHNIDAYTKTDVQNCYETFKEEIDKSINSHFRSPDNIERAIYQKYFVAVGHGTYKRVSRIDTSLPFYMRIINLIRKKYQKDSSLAFPHYRNIDEVLERFNPKLFCINDSEETTDDDRIYVKDFLKRHFPEKSNFEI